MRKDVAETAERLTRQGWVMERVSHKAHSLWRWPATGETICLPSTPSDGRSLANCEAQAARISGTSLRQKGHAGKFRHVRGSGFSIEAATASVARSDALVDRDFAALTTLHERARDLLREPRTRSQLGGMRHLIAEHLVIAKRLARRGETAPDFPVA